MLFLVFLTHLHLDVIKTIGFDSELQRCSPSARLALDVAMGGDGWGGGQVSPRKAPIQDWEPQSRGSSAVVPR